MNKLSVSLAVASIAFFSACSDEKAVTHEDLCANGVSVDCLVGNWNLDEVSGCANYRGTLNLSKNDYTYSNTIIPADEDGGTWSLDGNIINLDSPAWGNKRGKITLSNQGRTMTVESLDAQYTFSDCTDGGNPRTEKFNWKP